MKRRIAVKVFIVSFLLVESIIVVLGYWYYRHSSDSLLQAQYDNATQFADKANDYLKISLEHVRSLFITIGIDQRFLEGSDEEIEQWFNDTLLPYLPSVYNIHLLKNGQLSASTSYVQWALLENDRLNRELGQINANRVVYWIGPYYSIPSNYTVTAAMKIPTPAGEKVILLDLDLASLYESMQPQSTNPMNGKILLMDAAHKPVFGRPPYARYGAFTNTYSLTGIEAGWFEEDWKQSLRTTAAGQRLVLTRVNNDILGWDVVWILDKGVLLQPLRKTVTFTWALGVISLFLSLVMAYTISLYISKPIRNIANSMNAVGEGRLETTIRLNRDDELGLLAKHFNRMTAHIRELIEDLKTTEKQKQLSDFQALQAQIKPHFLFNTLNSISMAARSGEYGKVDQLISSLTDQLDYSLKTSPGPVTLHEEFGALESYVQLMTLRYPGKFRLQMDVDPDTWEEKLPKFVLQPLVENSIFHGLVPDHKDGVLFLGTTRGPEGWDIMIEDNGIGMSEEQLNELNNRLENPAPTGGSLAQPDEHGGSIGLANVHLRLQMMFGQRYSLAIESTPGEGTKLLIHLEDGDEQDDA